MKIHFHGAAGTVTGSQHIVEVNGKRIMLDCGLFQGKRKEAFELNRKVIFDGANIDCLVLSHAHIDHSGNAPTLVRNRFKGDIFCTQATRDLCAVMLMDSAHIQEQDLLFVNKLRARQQKNLFELLYSKDDVINAMDHFVGISPGRRREIFPGIYLSFAEAGHMLGSANIILDIHEQSTGRDLRLVYSGDIGRPGMPIIRDPELLHGGCDVLIMESTYGNRTHTELPESQRELERVVNDTHRRGGCLLVPSFAVGRTQQLVYSLHKLYLKRDIPNVPIYVDSPLATRVTDIFRLHPEAYDKETREFIFSTRGDDPFGFDTLRYTQSVNDSKELNFLREPSIIISASGMMEAGRILHHLRNRIGDSKNTILLTGWQAPHTLGRYIAEGRPTVKIFGEEFPVKAKVEMLTGFSGHADRDGLISWAGAMKKKPTRCFLVHGEPEASRSLAEGLKQELGFENIDIPEQHQVFEV